MQFGPARPLPLPGFVHHPRERGHLHHLSRLWNPDARTKVSLITLSSLSALLCRCSLPPIVLCFSLGTFLGSGAIFVTAAIYGVQMVGAK